jgi:hypothetical protein
MLHKILRASIVSAIMLILVSGAAFANQDDHQVSFTIPEIAILDLVGTGGAGEDVTFTIALADSESNAGLEPVITPSNNVKDLFYTSILGSTDTSRDIQVQISAGGPVPDGLILSINASAVGSSGAGNRGSSSNIAALTTTAVDIISGMTSCFTLRNSGTSGSQLTYNLNWDSDNFASIKAGTTNLTVLFTFQDN